MSLTKIKVEPYYSIARSSSQYICYFHAPSEGPCPYQAQIKTYPCLLSMYSALTAQGESGERLMNAVQQLLLQGTPAAYIESNA